MDVIFNCSHCDQELSVDAAGAGSEIECPSCGGRIVIPAPPEGAPAPAGGPRVIDAMATSAARKEEKHFSVPVHDKPAESLIAKPLVPLEVAAKEAIKLRFRKWISSLVFDRILSRQHSKNRRKVMRLAINCDLSFFHRFK